MGGGGSKGHQAARGVPRQEHGGIQVVHPQVCAVVGSGVCPFHPPPYNMVKNEAGLTSVSLPTLPKPEPSSDYTPEQDSPADLD